MNKIYLFLLTLIVGLSASARLVYYDNNTDDKLTTSDGLTPMCHICGNNFAYGSWGNDAEKMTSIDQGYIFKVDERAYTHLKFYTYKNNNAPQQSNSDIPYTDGHAYTLNNDKGMAVWKIHAGGNGQDWSDRVEFTYMNNNIYETNEIEVSWNGCEWGVRCMINGNQRIWLKTESSLSANTAVTVGTSGNNGKWNLSGKYKFRLDLNDLNNIKLSAISSTPVSTEMTNPYLTYNGTKVAWTSTGNNKYVYTADLKKGDVLKYFDGSDNPWGPDAGTEGWWVYPNGTTTTTASNGVQLKKQDQYFVIDSSDSSKTLDGEYTFTLDLSDAANPKVTATYQSNGGDTPITSVLPDPLLFAYNPGDNKWTFNHSGTRNGNTETFTFSSTGSTSYFIFSNGEAGWDYNTGNLYGSGTKDLGINSDGTAYPVSNNAEVWKLTDGPAQYEVTLNYATGKVSVKLIKKLADSGYYLFGDINRWSCLSNAGMTIEYKDLEANPSDIWGEDEAKNQTFLSKEDLNAYWQFVECAAPENATDKNNQWYVIDFSNLTDELGNKGRLCGQFKITRGTTSARAEENDDNWGTDNYGDSKAYLIDNTIKVNTEYEGKKGVKKGNFQLNCSYIDNAKLYFQPATGKIIITGDEKYIYAYYSVANTEDFSAPSKTDFANLSQLRYYVNYHPWNDSDASYNPGGIYNWKDVDAEELQSLGLNKAYTKGYKKLIPYGATHRFPVEFNCTVSRRDGSDFPAQRVLCDNLFFLETEPVNVWFRYEDEHLPAWVRFDAYIETYNDNGIISGRKWHTGAESTWAAMETAEYGGYTWFKSVTPVSGDFVNGSYALFETSENITYPRGGVWANSELRKEASINGEDLFYVVPSGRNGDLEILYSHLKGTYNADDTSDEYGQANHVLQINAELFNADGDLDTSYRDPNITYAFAIYPAGSTTAIASRDFGVDEGPDDSEYAPYLNVGTNLEPGYYEVRVDVRNNGATTTAYDVYPVFGTPSTPVALADVTPLASDTNYYIFTSKDDWTNRIQMTNQGDGTYTYTAAFTTGDCFLLANENRTSISWSDTNDYISPNDDSSNTDDHMFNPEALGQSISATTGQRHCVKFGSGNWSGNYTVTFDSYSMTITVTQSAGGGDDDDDNTVVLDKNGENYTIPDSNTMMEQFYLENAETKASASTTIKFITMNGHNGETGEASYSWVKYEDLSNYTAGLLRASDTNTIDSNTTKTHECKNFSDAYYRAYHYADTKPANKFRSAPAKTTAARVARTIFVADNTTGVEDVVVDGDKSVEDADAPVVFYNLQGVRVANPSNGVYIRVQGKTATKVYIR